MNHLFTILLLINLSLVSAQQHIQIQGTVTGIPNNNKLNDAKVVAIRADNGARVDSTFTNSSGYYSMGFIWVSNMSPEKDVCSVHPNPYDISTTLLYNARNSGTHTLLCFNAGGQVIKAMNIILEQGSNSLKITGGSAGVHLISISNGTQEHFYRILKTKDSNEPLNIEIIGSLPENRVLKSAQDQFLTAGDEVRMEFSKEDYYLSDTTFVIHPSQTINHTLQHLCTIEGTISGNPNSNVLEGAKVLLLKSQDASPLDSTYTDVNGLYSLMTGNEIYPGEVVKIVSSFGNTNPKNSYNPTDTVFVLAFNQTIYLQMQQQEYLFTTTLKPYLDDGTPVTTISPGWTTTLEFPAPVGTKTYTPNGNNEIVIQEGFYPLNGELGNVTMHHDTSNYTVNGTVNGVLSWIVLRTQNQPTEVRNKAQSFLTYDGNTQTTTFQDSLTTTLDSLDGLTLNYYTLPKKAEVQPGTWFRMDHGGILGYMLSSGGGFGSSKHIDIPEYAADSLIIILDKLHFTNGTPISSTNLDRADDQTDKILGLYDNMQNNDNITPKTARHRSQPGEPEWNKVANRGYVNSIILYFDQTSPVNSRSLKNDYTYDEEFRLDLCTASYSESATDGQIFAEHYSAITGIEEGSGSLVSYIYTSTGNPTDLAGRMARWVKLLDLGSGNSKK